MSMVECCRGFVDDPRCPGQIDSPYRRGVGSRDVLHRYPEVSPFGAAVMDCDDIRVLQSRNDIGFSLEAGSKLTIGKQRWVQQLQRSQPRQTRMPSQIHDPHAASAEHLLDPVSRKHFSSTQIGHTAPGSTARASSSAMLSEERMWTEAMPN